VGPVQVHQVPVHSLFTRRVYLSAFYSVLVLKYEYTQYFRTRINVAIGKYLIIKCNLPLNLVENQGFCDFMKECNLKWDPISTKRLKQNVIHTFSSKVDAIIHQTLNGVDHVTLTVNGWSDRRCRSFLGVTCHFIVNKMQPRSHLIDFVRLKSPHTGENIQQLTERILDRFNKKEKVYRIVTDNASSMIKAYQFGLSVEDDADDSDISLLDDDSDELSITHEKIFLVKPLILAVF
ncbi:unnamed protein product, partial [Adineta ricciae]